MFVYIRTHVYILYLCMYYFSQPQDDEERIKEALTRLLVNSVCVCTCLCVCVCACVRACMRACVRACVRACMCVHCLSLYVMTRITMHIQRTIDCTAPLQVCALKGVESIDLNASLVSGGDTTKWLNPGEVSRDYIVFMYIYICTLCVLLLV